jgi:hypothetical protein
MPRRRGSVPEGRRDRSLARSAWNSPTPKNRPVGHGMNGSRPNPGGVSRQNVRRVPLRKADHSNHRIAPTGANQTVPYGTARLGWRFPGTSCQATIGPSLRDWGKATFAFGATNRLKHSLT